MHNMEYFSHNMGVFNIDIVCQKVHFIYTVLLLIQKSSANKKVILVKCGVSARLLRSVFLVGSCSIIMF